jgi:hypothetical protein
MHRANLETADLVNGRRLEAIRTSLNAPGLPESHDLDDLVEVLKERMRVRFYRE